MPSIFLGVRLPEQPYFRMQIQDVDYNKRVTDFKTDIKKLLNQSDLILELIYCGDVLVDEQTLQEQNVNIGSTIHVLPKSIDPIPHDINHSDADIKAACAAYNKLKDFSRVSTDTVIPEALKIVLEKYPELNKELGALAILKNKILLTKLRKIEAGKELAAIYPTLIRAAPFIVQTYNDTLKKWVKNGLIPPSRIEEDSDTMDNMESDDDSTGNSAGNSTRPTAGGGISRNQLADALLIAGSSALQTSRAQASSDSSTSSSANSRPSTSNSSSGNRISSAAFQNALQNAYREAAGIGNAVEPEVPAVTASRPEDEIGAYIDQSRSQFTSELQIMREMGLLDDSRNIQALIVCNGDVERAINLVLASVGGI